jgi:hypothetical protein
MKIAFLTLFQTLYGCEISGSHGGKQEDDSLLGYSDI